MTITVSTLLFFQYFVDYSTISFISEKFVFFKEPLFYIALLLNFFTQYLYRKVNKLNDLWMTPNEARFVSEKKESK